MLCFQPYFAYGCYFNIKKVTVTPNCDSSLNSFPLSLFFLYLNILYLVCQYPFFIFFLYFRKPSPPQPWVSTVIAGASVDTPVSLVLVWRSKKRRFVRVNTFLTFGHAKSPGRLPGLFYPMKKDFLNEGDKTWTQRFWSAFLNILFKTQKHPHAMRGDIFCISKPMPLWRGGTIQKRPE